MYRELYEEIGLKPEDVTIMATSRNWLKYRLPKRLVRWDSSPVCIGQNKMVLAAAGSAGVQDPVRLSWSSEFDDWRWVSFWYPVRQVVSFKREVYRRVMKEFARWRCRCRLFRSTRRMGGAIAPVKEHRLVVNGTQTHRRKHGRGQYPRAGLAGTGQPDPAGHDGGLLFRLCLRTRDAPLPAGRDRWSGRVGGGQGHPAVRAGHRRSGGSAGRADQPGRCPPIPASSSCPMWPKRRFALFLGAPIMHQRQVVGILVVQQKESRLFDEGKSPSW